MLCEKTGAATILYPVAAVGAVILLLLLGGEVTAQAEAGVSLCTDVLIPSLFPALAAAEFLVRTGGAERVGRWLSPLTRPLFGLSDSGSGALLLGLICGFPLGANAAGTLWRAGEIDGREAERLMLFAHAPSPAFLVSAVGERLLGNRQAGWIVWVCCLLAALTVGFIAQRLAPLSPPEEERQSRRSSGGAVDCSPGSIVCSAGDKMLRLCGTVLLFAALSAPVLQLPLPAFWRACILLSLELTNGTKAAAALPFPTGFLLVALGAGFGGLSVHSQISALGAPVSPLRFALARLSSALLTGLYAFILCFWCLPSVFSVRGGMGFAAFVG